MKWLQILRAILNLLYFFSWMTAVCAPFIAWMAVEGIDVNAAGLGTGYIKSKPALYIILSLMVIGYFCFLAMIHHLRKAAYKITPYQLISATLQNHFYKAGLFCVIGGLLSKLPSVAYQYIISPLLLSNRVAARASIDFGYGFDSILVTLTFGIFLIIFSKIIQISLQWQEEQALTV